MSDLFRRVLPRTITAQMSALVVGAVLLGVFLTFAVMLTLAGSPKMRMSPNLKAAAEAARIATVVKDLDAAGSPSDAAAILADARSSGGRFERLSLPSRPSGASTSFADAVAAHLRHTWDMAPQGESGDLIFMEIRGGGVLQVQVSEFQTAQTFLIAQAGILLTVILIVVLAVTVYAVRAVIRPLSSFAEAAHAFGRPAAEDSPLKTDGPAEIARVAHALNDMRKRVRGLLEERTRMLAAISHDLRTPLTRLRLRSDRFADPAERANMLNDIASIDGMITETLAYLRDSNSTEAMELTDLPSLLQTICGEFADVGHEVHYDGPGRWAMSCRARALARAVSNVIDNGVKHGTTVTVKLLTPSPSAVHIEIADDGPGIPSDLWEKVFEPFYKADGARSRPGETGFGLGLSITREIVERHGGVIILDENRPQGLLVRIALPVT